MISTMKYLFTVFATFLFLFSCTSSLLQKQEFIEFKFIGLVFSNYYMDSLLKVDDANSPFIFTVIYINNTTIDSVFLTDVVKAELSYFDIPYFEPRKIYFPCKKLCPPMPPNVKGYQELINSENSFWLESGYIWEYNDSMVYKNRCNQLYGNSKITFSFFEKKFSYKVKESNIMYINDYDSHLFNPKLLPQMRYKMHENSPFPVERIYVK